jgi:hypothetical protein
VAKCLALPDKEIKRAGGQGYAALSRDYGEQAEEWQRKTMYALNDIFKGWKLRNMEIGL